MGSMVGAHNFVPRCSSFLRSQAIHPHITIRTNFTQAYSDRVYHQLTSDIVNYTPEQIVKFALFLDIQILNANQDDKTKERPGHFDSRNRRSTTIAETHQTVRIDSGGLLFIAVSSSFHTALQSNFCSFQLCAGADGQPARCSNG